MSNDIFERNLNVLRKRWPVLADKLEAQDVATLSADLSTGQDSTLIVDGVQLSSRHDQIAEAHLQASSLPDGLALIYLYGIGLGELPRAFLRRHGLECLEVRLLSETVFALILRVADQTDWLEDPRVCLASASGELSPGEPCFASPAELVLASDENCNVRDQLVANLTSHFVNASFAPELPKFNERLEANVETLKGDGDVSELFATRPGSEIWIMATGPTLAEHFEHLQQVKKQQNSPLMIAVDTALRPLCQNNIRPDLVVSIDFLINDQVLPADQSDELPLVYFPLLPPSLLRSWRGRRYGAYGDTSFYDGLSNIVRKGRLFSGGSVLHAAVDLAVKMGATKVVLFGTDFALVGDRMHAEWEEGILASRNESNEWTLNGHGNRVRTFLNFQAYRVSLERYIRNNPSVIFFNASRNGAFIAGTTYHPEFSK